MQHRGDLADFGHQLVELVGDDPGIPEDLKAWCRGIGHGLEALEVSGSVITARVRRRVGRAA